MTTLTNQNIGSKVELIILSEWDTMYISVDSSMLKITSTLHERVEFLDLIYFA